MLSYTKAASKKIISDFKLACKISSIIVQVIFIAYLIYALILDIGYVIANAISLGLSVSFLIFLFVLNDEVDKKQRKKIKRVHKWIKLIIDATTLGISIYAVYCTTKSIELVAVIFTGAMVISWVLKVVAEIMSAVIEHYIEFFIDGIQYDIEKLNPVQSVKNLVCKIQGKENLPDYEKISEKNRNILDALVKNNRKAH